MAKHVPLTMEEMELIQRLYVEEGNSIEVTARLSGIGRTRIEKMLAKCGLARPKKTALKEGLALREKMESGRDGESPLAGILGDK